MMIGYQARVFRKRWFFFSLSLLLLCCVKANSRRWTSWKRKEKNEIASDQVIQIEEDTGRGRE